MSVAPSTEFINLMDMKLHEIRIVEGRVEDCLFTTVMRVPGGLVYRSFDKAAPMMAAVFVPVAGWDTAHLANFIKQNALESKGGKE